MQLKNLTDKDNLIAIARTSKQAVRVEGL